MREPVKLRFLREEAWLKLLFATRDGRKGPPMEERWRVTFNFGAGRDVGSGGAEIVCRCNTFQGARSNKVVKIKAKLEGNKRPRWLTRQETITEMLREEKRKTIFRRNPPVVNTRHRQYVRIFYTRWRCRREREANGVLSSMRRGIGVFFFRRVWCDSGLGWRSLNR